MWDSGYEVENVLKSSKPSEELRCHCDKDVAMRTEAQYAGCPP